MMENSHLKHAEKPLAQVRLKKDQVEDQHWIMEMVESCAYGSLGSMYKQQPYVTPVTYVYSREMHSIFFHGAKTGRLRANIHFNDRVSFSLVKAGDVFSHAQASEFNLGYQSVTIFGRASLQENIITIRTALEALLKKYAPNMTPGIDYQDIQDNEIAKTSVYQIKIQDWTGKQQVYDPDFYSGAFPFVPVPVDGR
ncbi:MAG: pyridoxamine 5'-phosphate oxidase family protein [Anaerolineae bacterium]|nr:pyridoxamine 5'-phosphate oxidase family protein [Anaerolineae bacterium]